MSQKYEQSNIIISQQERALTGNRNDQTASQIAQDLLLLNHRAQTSLDNQRTSIRSEFYTSQSNSNGLSDIEIAILRSSLPIDLNETEEIIVNGEKGIWANKAEIVNWRGVLPLSQYAINDDPNPEIIRKKTDQNLVYQQEVAIRYLRPPTPPPPGPILIQQEANTQAPPAPPLVIRQQPARPVTPPPLVVREAPPHPPPAVGKRIITIFGKRIPPPPRKVIIERLATLPSKPQSVIIERWLPYRQVKRKVIFAKSNEKEIVMTKPKNVIVQWQAPQVTVQKEFKDLGVVRANPIEYVQRYGSSLKRAIELPSFVKEIRPPAGVTLAAESGSSNFYELEGDVYALNLVDLEREGLVEYKYSLKQVEASNSAIESTISSSENLEFVNELFRSLELESNSTVSLSEAERIFSKLYTRLGKRFNDLDAKSIFSSIDFDSEGRIDVINVRKAFEKQFK